MTKRSRILVALSATALIAACSGGVLTEAVEDPIARGGTGGTGGTGGGNTGSVSMSWQAPVTNDDGSTLSDLDGFRVYMGTSQDLASLSPVATVNNVSVSVYLVENLAPGNYYFSVTAFNSQNLESEFSNLMSASVN